MSYIGRQPLIGNFITCDALTASATTTYNLTSGGAAVSPQTAANCIVSLDGVNQSPTTAYTISGSTIIFSTTLSSSNTIDYIQVLGNVLNIGTPTNGTVSVASLASGFALPATSGGTGTTTYTAGNILYASNATTLTTLAPGTSGYALTLNGTTPTWAAVGASAGQVIQVVSTTQTTAFGISVSTTPVDLTGMNLSITPSSTSNKILLLWKITYTNSTGDGIWATMQRNGSNIAIGTNTDQNHQGTIGFNTANSNNYWSFEAGGSYLDSPSSTSSLTYKFQVTAQSNYTLYINRTNRGTYDGSYISTLTAMEIKG